MAVDPGTWGVTVSEVVALAPHATVSDEPSLPENTVWTGSTQKIRSGDVERWITDVSAVVNARLSSRADLSTDLAGALGAAAHAVVVVGAGSYLVSAAFPMKAGTNESSSYSAELWNRYQSALAALDEQLNVWLDTNTPVVGKPSGVSGGFPPPAFPDMIRW